MNWKLWARVSLLGFFVMLGWLLFPAADCAAKNAQAQSLGGLTEDSEMHDWMYGRHDHPGEAPDARSFVHRFFGGAGACYNEHPVTGQEPWKQGACGGFLLAYFLLRIIGRESWKAQVRRTSRFS